jgi:hypothetical protein
MLQRSRGRTGGRAADGWSYGSGDVGFRSAGSSRRNRALLRSFYVGIFSLFFVLAGVRTFSIRGILLLLWLTDIPDKGLGVGIIHIAVGQLLAMSDIFRIRGLYRSFAHRAQTFKISLLIPGKEVCQGFVGSNLRAGIPPFFEANLGELQIIAEIKRVSGSSLSRPKGRVCLLSTKEEIFSIRGHGLFVGIQSDQLFRHVPVGRVNRNIPVHPIHLQSLLDVFDGSREHV